MFFCQIWWLNLKQCSFYIRKFLFFFNNVPNSSVLPKKLINHQIYTKNILRCQNFFPIISVSQPHAMFLFFIYWKRYGALNETSIQIFFYFWLFFNIKTIRSSFNFLINIIIRHFMIVFIVKNQNISIWFQIIFHKAAQYIQNMTFC